jgi:hypothetical protein
LLLFIPVVKTTPCASKLYLRRTGISSRRIICETLYSAARTTALKSNSEGLRV